jgi:Putative phage tail protein
VQTVEELKQLECPETPIFLFSCIMASGEVERWSTHHVTAGGQEYRARVLGHSLFELKLSSDDGADTGSKISVTLANVDSYFSVLERTTGFKGAQLTIEFVFFSLKDGQPASDTRVLFRGIAGSPDEITEGTLRVTFTNRLSLQRVSLPWIRIQKRCPWAFPGTEAQRLEAIDGGVKGKFSPFYRCGYSAGLAGGCGNLDATGKPFTLCAYTKTECIARGLYDKDSSGNETRRFGGIQFVPSTVSVRGYGEKGSHLSAIQANEAKYNDVVPMLYGTAWYTPPIVCARNDGNLTRMEALLGSGEMTAVLKVLVNDIEIPEAVAGANMTATGWYNVITPGTRNGAFDPDFADASGNPLGDPYGSMAMMSVVVPNRVSTGQSLPRIKVLAQGRKLQRFDQTGAPAGEVFTNNPGWVLLDVLRQSGWQAADIDLASFAQAASYFEAPVAVQDLNGNPTTAPRFECNLPLQSRRSAADLARGIRNGSMALLSYSQDGRLQLRAENTLSAQQPVKAPGTNSVEALAGGWPAYEFSDSTRPFSGILRRPNGEPYLRVFSKGMPETVNRLSVEFQDEFNEYQQDSLSLVDIDDANLTGQERNGSMAALGLANFDQASRILSLALRKSVDGNVFVEFATSVRAFGLTPGDLIALTYAKEGFDRTPFRVQRIAPGVNFRTALITAQIHDDEWYSSDGIDHPGGRRRGQQSSLPRPLVGSVVDENGQAQFSITETLHESADGSASVQLSVGFNPPATVSIDAPATPVLSLTPVIRESGGSLAAGTYYYAVSAVDSLGNESGLSFSVRASAPAGSAANSVSLQDLSFGPGTTAFHVYRGASPGSLLRLAANVPVSAVFVDDGSGTPNLIGPPDANYDHANFYWRLELQPEAGVTSHSANTAGCSDLSMTANEFRRSAARITRGLGAGQERSIIGNDTTTVTVAPKWDIEPDSTSFFVIAEPSWRFGALTAAGPAVFEIPDRTDAIVEVSGRAASVHDQEGSPDLCPLTRHEIGGSGLTGDTDVPPVPSFALYAAGEGAVELMGIAFADLTNTRTVTAGTLTLWYQDELSNPGQVALGAAVDDKSGVIHLAAAGEAAVGDVLLLEQEGLTVSEVSGDGLSYNVMRGSHNSSAVAHGAGANVVRLARNVQIVPFVRNFFGSPASGSYTHSMAMQDIRICAAEIFLTNVQGSGPVSSISFTNLLDGGLRTLSGGQYSIQVDGVVAIEAEAAPAIVADSSHSIHDVFAVAGSAPAGGPVQLRVKQGSDTLCQLTIADGSTASNVVSGVGLKPLQSGSLITLEVVSVPQADGSFPGRDLTVSIRL